jgi:hypothetical protein
MTPSYRTDMLAVAAHSHAARQRQAVRDGALCTVLVTTVLVLVRRWGSEPIMASGLIVVACAVAGGILSHKDVGWPEVLAWLRRRCRVDSARASQELVLLIVVLVLGSWLALTESAVLSALKVVGAGLLAAWAVAMVDAGVARARARTIRDSPRRIRDLAPPPPGWLIDRLEPFDSPERVNFYVYDCGLRFVHTLVGNGEPVHEWQISIDIGQGKLKPGKAEEREKPQPVEVLELHEALRASAALAGVSGLWCGYRVYADGRFLLRDGRLPEDRPDGPPLTRVSRAEQLEGLIRVDERRRTYLCMQIDNWNGDLMVTLFVRAEVTAGILYLYSKVYVLPGIEEPMPVRKLPRHAPEAVGRAMATAGIRFVPLLLWSPVRCLGFLADPWWRWMRRTYERYTVRRGAHFDFGAKWSLREALVFGQQLQFNARDDLMRDLYVLESRLAKALKDHLDRLNIDTSSIEKTITAIIISQQMTFNAKNIKIGGDGRAGDTVNNLADPSVVGTMPASNSSTTAAATQAAAATAATAAAVTTDTSAAAAGSTTTGS